MATTFIEDNGHRYMIWRYKIIGTNVIVHSAWRLDKEANHVGEPINRCHHNHGTITHEDGQWWGRIGSAVFLTEEKNNLPVGDERTKVVYAAYEEEYQLAYQLILQAHPEASIGRKQHGEIETLAV